MRLSYEATRRRLYDLRRFGVRPGLDTMTALLSTLGNPHRRFPALHIAGTNGKGSVAAMAASMLQVAGVRVGLYTSPHLLDFCERIQIRGAHIPEERVVDVFARIMSLPPRAVPSTFFEVATGMAFQYFADEQVDVAVIETGLGGRFDATNVCVPTVTVITNVSFDHEQYLGDSLEAIAFEKAGIIKRNVPVVMGPTPPSPGRVLREHAHRMHAPVVAFGDAFTSVSHASGAFDILGRHGEYANLHCALEGRHQAVNAGCAVAALESGVMSQMSMPMPIPDQVVRQGLARVSWPGRFERMPHHPPMLCDGAHNPAAAECLAAALRRTQSEQGWRRLLLVVGMMRDKNISAFLRTMVPLADVVIVTRIDSPRAATVDELQEAMPATDVPVHARDSPHAAINLAACLGSENDLICVTGSLFLVGCVKSLLAGQPYEPVIG